MCRDHQGAIAASRSHTKERHLSGDNNHAPVPGERTERQLLTQLALASTTTTAGRASQPPELGYLLEAGGLGSCARKLASEQSTRVTKCHESLTSGRLSTLGLGLLLVISCLALTLLDLPERNVMTQLETSVHSKNMNTVTHRLCASCAALRASGVWFCFFLISSRSKP